MRDGDRGHRDPAAAGGALPALPLRLPRLRPGVDQAAPAAGASSTGFASFSGIQESLLHDPAMLPRLLDYLTVQVSEMFRYPSCFRAILEKVVPHSADLSFREGLDRRLQQRARSSIRRRSCSVRKASTTGTAVPRYRHQSGGARRRERRLYSLDRPRFHRNHRTSGPKSSLSDYYTAAYGKAAFDNTFRERVVFSRP